GNSVSSFVTFALFASSALAALQGARQTSNARQAVLMQDVRQNLRREQALRVRLTHANGRVEAIPNGLQGSHMVSSLVGADALAMISSGDGVAEAGTEVTLEVLPN